MYNPALSCYTQHTISFIHQRKTEKVTAVMEDMWSTVHNTEC